MSTVTDRFNEIAQRFPAKPAFLWAGAGGFQSISYGAFRQAVSRMSARLRERGCRPGDRVLLLADYTPAWCAAYLGIHAAGCTAVPLDAQYSEREVDTLFRFISPAAVLTNQAHGSILPSAAIAPLFMDGMLEPGEAEIPFAPVPLPEDAPMSIIFTSGTTGDPKGVMLSTENFRSNVTGLQSFPGLISDRDVLLAMLPLHHVYGFTVTCLLPLLTGCTVVFPRSLAGADILAAMQEGITFLVGVPQVLTLFRKKIYDTAGQAPVPVRALFFLLRKLTSLSRNYFRINPGRIFFRKVHRSFPKLRYMASGGARLEPDVFRDLFSLGFSIIEAYGLTETAPIACLNDRKHPVPGSVGKAMPEVQVRIDAPAGGFEQGEVLIQGPNVMMGYYNRPEETKAAVVGGWFHSGDLGYLDKDDNLFLTGRKKEIIVLPNGKNIYPEELEKLYTCTERIKETCVLALGARGEEKLTLVVRPDMDYFKRIQNTSLFETIKYDIETVALSLPSYQRVTRIEIVDQDLPRTRLGKLKRFQIREMIEGKEVSREAPELQEESTDPFLRFLMKETEAKFIPRPEHTLETDLGLDSLMKMELFAGVEKKFGVRISPEQAGEIITVGNLRDLVGERDETSANGAFDLTEEMKKPPEVPMKKKVDIGTGLFGEIVRFFGHFTVLFLLKLLMRAKIRGLENLPREGAFIIAGNHVSYIDALMVYGMLPYRVTRRMISMSIPEIFGRFPLSLIRKPCRIIMTGTQDTMISSIRYAYAALNQGFPMVIFPEGKRSVNGSLDKPKPGAFHLARACNAPVIPIYLTGVGNLYSRKAPGFHFSRLEVDILPPLPMANTVEEMMAAWHTALKPFNDRELG